MGIILGTLVEHLTTVGDPRTGNFKPHSLQEILVIAICAILAGAESFVEMEAWAQARESWLRRFLLLKNGIPSHDTINRIFQLINPEQFESAFHHVAVDGKCLRRSDDKQHEPIHMVSAFATELGLVLGQEKIADKSNEIKAVPLLLQALNIKGCLISLDAMGCQKEIVRTIVAQKADYLVAVKGPLRINGTKEPILEQRYYVSLTELSVE